IYIVDSHLILFIEPRPPPSSLFPYTTLFRSASSTLSRRVWGAVSAPVAGVGMSGSVVSVTVGFPYFRAVVTSFMPRGLLPSNGRSEEHTSELQSRENLVCRLLLEKKKKDADV